MNGAADKSDLRIIKTEKALIIAIFALLRRYNFGKIRVRDICDEAQVSRATFYAHFTDKYDLLKYWLGRLKQDYLGTNTDYEQIETVVNDFIRDNEPVMRNLLYDADRETMNIIFQFILSALGLPYSGRGGEGVDPKYIVLSNFYAGGMLSYILWQIENKLPADIAPINRHVYEVAKYFQGWK